MFRNGYTMFQQDFGDSQWSDPRHNVNLSNFGKYLGRYELKQTVDLSDSFEPVDSLMGKGASDSYNFRTISSGMDGFATEELK